MLDLLDHSATPCRFDARPFIKTKGTDDLATRGGARYHLSASIVDVNDVTSSRPNAFSCMSYRRSRSATMGGGFLRVAPGDRNVFLKVIMESN